jgi:hypothetical protein
MQVDFKFNMRDKVTYTPLGITGVVSALAVSKHGVKSVQVDFLLKDGSVDYEHFSEDECELSS